MYIHYLKLKNIAILRFKIKKIEKKIINIFVISNNSYFKIFASKTGLDVILKLERN